MVDAGLLNGEWRSRGRGCRCGHGFRGGGRKVCLEEFNDIREGIKGSIACNIEPGEGWSGTYPESGKILCLRTSRLGPSVTNLASKFDTAGALRDSAIFCCGLLLPGSLIDIRKRVLTRREWINKLVRHVHEIACHVYHVTAPLYPFPAASSLLA